MSPSEANVPDTSRPPINARARRYLDRTWTRLEKLRFTLYRYVGLRGEKLGWFERGSLQSEFYLPGFDEFNDPFDGAVVIDVRSTRQQRRDYVARARLRLEGQHWNDATADLIERGGVQARDFLQRVIDRDHARYGILSLSETWQDLPMWAYYGEAHEGACLRFNIEGMKSLGDYPVPVVYRRRYPTLNLFRDDDWFMQVVTRLNTKAQVWRHEREWRLPSTVRGYQPFPPEALTGVILGSAIPPNTMRRVRGVLDRRDRPVELFRARMVRESFDLGLERIL